jgi:hypothetical protein
MDPTGVPYSFITEDHELHVDPVYFETYWQYRDKWLKTLREFFQLPIDNYLTCHGFAVLNSEYAKNLLSVLKQKNMTVADALEICPYEFSWYNFWVEKNYSVSRVIREPIFKTVHIQSEYLVLAIKSVSQEDFARGYIGVVINSGFSRSSGTGRLDAPLGTVLGSYIGYQNLMGAIFERLFIRMPRIRSLFGKGRRPRIS